MGDHAEPADKNYQSISRLGKSLPVLLPLAALLFLLSGFLKPGKQVPPRISPLPLETASSPLVSGSGFSDDGVFPTTTRESFGGDLRKFGSWLGSDASVGTTRSGWFRATPKFRILVAGYPVGRGCELFIEGQEADGRIQRITMPHGGNPGESWRTETISFANLNLSRFRLVAIDASAGLQSWVGFSQPFEFRESEAAERWRQLLLVALTASAAFVAILFPGLFLRHRSVELKRAKLPFLWIPLTGFLGLATLGLLCWVAPSSIGVRNISRMVLGPVFVYALYHVVRFPLSTYLSELERRALLVILVLASLSISKSIYSLGPVGELYGGQISRTLEVGGRSDSRIPYHVLQLVAWRSRPYSDLAIRFFSPWNFSSRGPLVALATAPIVLAIPVNVPNTMPDQKWSVFDPQGFSAYRIVMIVVACCTLTAVFEIAALFLEAQWAFLAFLVTASTPFVIHETYFTWPKLEAVWFVLLAAYLIVRCRYLRAGVLVGIGYLCHPLVLLSFPALLGISFLSEESGRETEVLRWRKLYKWGLQAFLLLPGLAFCMSIWFVINRKHYSQSGFLDYFYAADGLNLTLGHWLLSRWDSICNTLIPLNLFLLHRTHLAVNAVDGASPHIVQFYLQYWNTLPFGVGITYFFFLVRFLWEGLMRARAWVFLVFVVPFAFFSAYWGPISTGMLREGLHPWVVGLLIFSVVMWRKMGAHNHYSAACSIALLLRGVETILMLVLPSMLSQHEAVSSQFLTTDIIALLVMAGSAAWLYWLTFRLAWKLSATTIPATSMIQSQS